MTKNKGWEKTKTLSWEEEITDIVYGILLEGKFTEAGERKARGDAIRISEEISKTINQELRGLREEMNAWWGERCEFR